MIHTLTRHVRRWIVLCLVVGLSVTACNANLKRATCGWSSNIPANGNQVCQQTYATLRRIVRAEVNGNDGVIRALVVSPTVARRIIQFGRLLRQQHVSFLRVTPTFDLTTDSHNVIQVDAYLIGQSDQGKVEVPEWVLERPHGKSFVITGDFPGQQW